MKLPKKKGWPGRPASVEEEIKDHFHLNSDRTVRKRGNRPDFFPAPSPAGKKKKRKRQINSFMLTRRFLGRGREEPLTLL